MSNTEKNESSHIVLQKLADEVFSTSFYKGIWRLDEMNNKYIQSNL